MLVALFTLLFLGGGGGADLLINFDQIRQNAKTEITDDDRRDAALDVFKAVESDRKDFSKQLQEHAKAIGKLYEDPTASAAAADAIWDDFYGYMEAHHVQLLDRREELQAHITPSEWSAIFAPDAAD